MATTKEKLPVLEIKASCLNIRHIAIIIRQVAVTYHCSTNRVRNLKFFTPFFIFLTTIKQYYTIYKPKLHDITLYYQH